MRRAIDRDLRHSCRISDDRASLIDAAKSRRQTGSFRGENLSPEWVKHRIMLSELWLSSEEDEVGGVIAQRINPL